jgi:hypothetical protein
MLLLFSKRRIVTKKDLKVDEPVIGFSGVYSY